VDRSWVWDGGRPSIDLLNTMRDRTTGGRELLTGPGELAGWLAAAGLVPAGTATGDLGVGAAELEAARRLRDAIDAAVISVLEDRPCPREAIDVINDAASAVPPAPRLVLDEAGRPRTAPPAAPAPAALARVAVDAIELLTSGEARRLRICAAEDCGIRFVDRSPARNRQWCSMARCGNRRKARRHYARSR
jgi:predicted RNA-binding Zn ribbon-like protein